MRTLWRPTWRHVPRRPVVYGAAAVVTVEGQASSDVAVTATAQGVAVVEGQASSDIAVAATAAGVVTVTGAATSDVAVTATAQGVRDVQAQASSDIAVTATAAGVREVLGAASSDVAVTATASGTTETIVSGAAAADIAVTATAQGVRIVVGQASCDVAVAAAAQGVREVHGQATSTITVTATVVVSGARQLAAFVETTRRWDRHTGTIRHDRHHTAARPNRHTTATRSWDRFHAAARHDRVTGTPRWDRVTGSIRHKRFWSTRIYREDADVTLEIVALGDFTQGEIPEALLIQWVRTHNDGTTSGLPLFNQTPAYTVTGKLEQPNGTIITRACTIENPADLSTNYPDEPQVAPFVDNTHGWVRFDFDEGDLDQLPAVGEITRIQLIAARATTPPIRLKTADVWDLTVNAGPAAAVGA